MKGMMSDGLGELVVLPVKADKDVKAGGCNEGIETVFFYIRKVVGINYGAQDWGHATRCMTGSDNQH